MKATNDPIQQRVLSVLDRMRDYLRADGGDVRIIDITDEHVVLIELLGACRDCPYRQQTLAGIEQAVIKEVPEVKEVRDINSR
jgi:Fe-S cluster biogenesis protein NfuA